MRLEGPLEKATLPLGVSDNLCLERATALDPGEVFLAATLIVLHLDSSMLSFVPEANLAQVCSRHVLKCVVLT